MKNKTNKEPHFIIKIGKFLTNKLFFKNLLFIAIFLVLLVFGINLWLKFYTNHGQKLELPDFNNMHINEAKKVAEDKSFKLIIIDSIQKVGRPGGYIINQNPKAHAMVKENRKIYVTTTKYEADKINVSSLPKLYGRAYDQKKKELANLQIGSRIKGKKYDIGAPDHILEVYYKDQLIIDKNGRNEDVQIDKGASLDFVVSEQSGLEMDVPNLRCMTFSAARFIVEGSRLKLGSISTVGDITNQDEAYIVSQNPAFQENATMLIGTPIDIMISAEKPADCQ